MPFIAVYGWNLYTIPGLSQAELEASTHGNDPAQVGTNPYNPAEATWTGTNFTFNGGASTLIEIADDDGDLQDAYVETGGGQTIVNPVTVDGVTYPAGSAIQLEFSLLDSGLEVFVIRIGSTNVGFTYAKGDEPTAGDVLNFDDARDGDGADSLDQTTSSSESYSSFLCFTPGTLLQTPSGPQDVAQLQPGDQVSTLDHGAQPVAWIHHSRHRWDVRGLRGRPVQFKPGSLGNGLPRRTLTVSPQHRMLLHDPEGDADHLVPAKAFVDLPGVRVRAGCRRITYIHVMFERHEVVHAEGAACESFYPGSQAVSALEQEGLSLPSELMRRWAQKACAPARPFLTVQDGRRRLRAISVS